VAAHEGGFWGEAMRSTLTHLERVDEIVIDCGCGLLFPLKMMGRVMVIRR
jgi:hypothetical protein